MSQIHSKTVVNHAQNQNRALGCANESSRRRRPTGKAAPNQRKCHSEQPASGALPRIMRQPPLDSHGYLLCQLYRVRAVYRRCRLLVSVVLVPGVSKRLVQFWILRAVTRKIIQSQSPNPPSLAMNYSNSDICSGLDRRTIEVTT